MTQNACRIGVDSGRPVLELAGDWRLARLPELARALGGARATSREPAAVDRSSLVAIDGTALSALDTAAALQLCRWLRAGGSDPSSIELRGFEQGHERILRLVARTSEAQDESDLQAPRGRGALAALGASTIAMLDMLRGHVGFLGYVLVEISRALASPKQLRFGELLTQLSRVCVSAVPVVALVTCLIGLVFAYLLGLQAEQYGANIFVVDGVALGMTREFSPMIVAVIVAGRSGAAFAAQLGTMRLNEETDAIAILGLSVAQVLVVPRVLALVLTMPLLVFVGNVAGLAGAAAIADLMLDVTPSTFVTRLHDALAPRHVLIGLAKAPFFALLIAVIGCRMGMSGPRDTRTIGTHTTSTVVQGIVGVIVIDAIFAILMQRIGW